MTKYVLIWVVFHGSGVATSTPEFDDWVACQSAWRWLKGETGKIEQDQTDHVFAVCYPKARPQQIPPG